MSNLSQAKRYKLVLVLTAATPFALAPSLWAQSLSAQEDIDLDVTVFSDLRLAHASGERSWLHNDFGKTRYGNSLNGDGQTRLELAEVAAVIKGSYGWDWKSYAHLAYAPEQDNPLDVIEGFIAYKPAPTGQVNWSGRAGLMFPEISKEHTAVAWTSPYSLTPSAINSWVGEEIRTLGLEATATWRLDRESHLALTASLFGFNDPAGTLLAWRGWALHDYKVGAYDTAPIPPLPSIVGDNTATVQTTSLHAQGIHPFAHHGGNTPFNRQALYSNPVKEIDNRPGYYVAFDYQANRDVDLGVMGYDNRAEPTALKDGQYGWRTKFAHAFAQWTPTSKLTLLSQAMTGKTLMGSTLASGRRAVDVTFRSAFLLASYQQKAWRYTARIDGFKTIDYSWLNIDDNTETGHSVMIAVRRDLSDNAHIVAEFLTVKSDRHARADLGFPEITRVHQWQLAYRFSF